ncbi:MAG: hypothetical protein ACK5WQ_00485 [Alphaproteobacteria bacterium]|jgi:hypothetical protein
MTDFIRITEDQFHDFFKPMKNHLNPHASFDWGDGFGTLFETYGQEYEFVKSQPQNKIWTFCNGDDGDFIVSGWHYVNRVGYFITEIAFHDNAEIEVQLESVDCEEERL